MQLPSWVSHVPSFPCFVHLQPVLLSLWQAGMHLLSRYAFNSTPWLAIHPRWASAWYSRQQIPCVSKLPFPAPQPLWCSRRNALCLVNSWEIGVSFLSRCSQISQSTNECLSFLVYNGHSLCLVTVKKKKSINVFNKLPNAHVWVYWGGGCSLLKFPESCWVHGTIASSQQDSHSCRNRLSGQSQNQVINTLLRKHIGLAVGRDGSDVRWVAKLKITFFSPSCHNVQREGKHWQGRFVQRALTR